MALLSTPKGPFGLGAVALPDKVKGGQSPRVRALHLPSLLRQWPRVCRYAWFSPDAATEVLTGPNALYYGEGNQTALTGLGKIYLEQLHGSGCSTVR